MLDKIYQDTRQRMQKTVEATSRELATIRTGKASPKLLDTVKVEVYGTVMPLNQLATISVPEARLLVLQVFDKSAVGDVTKAIQMADLGMNPAVDGQTIRLPVPPLNEERRKELVRRCRQLAEDGRVAVRNIRRDANELLKKEEKAKSISEDQADDGRDEVQKATDEAIGQIDELLAKKEKEVMEV